MALCSLIMISQRLIWGKLKTRGWGVDGCETGKSYDIFGFFSPAFANNNQKKERWMMGCYSLFNDSRTYTENSKLCLKFLTIGL
jgi:hypothetical protein